MTKKTEKEEGKKSVRFPVSLSGKALPESWRTGYA